MKKLWPVALALSVVTFGFAPTAMAATPSAPTKPACPIKRAAVDVKNDVKKVAGCVGNEVKKVDSAIKNDVKKVAADVKKVISKVDGDDAAPTPPKSEAEQPSS